MLSLGSFKSYLPKQHARGPGPAYRTPLQVRRLSMNPGDRPQRPVSANIASSPQTLLLRRNARTAFPALAHLHRHCLGVGTPVRRLQLGPVSADIASSPGTLALRWNARAMFPSLVYRALHGFISTDAGPAQERRGIVSIAGLARRTLLRLPQHRPGAGTRRRCFPRRSVSADVVSALERQGDVSRAGASPAAARQKRGGVRAARLPSSRVRAASAAGRWAAGPGAPAPPGPLASPCGCVRGTAGGRTPRASPSGGRSAP